MSITSAQDLVGIFPALFTPILSDDPKRLRNSIDYKKAELMIEDSIATGVQGIVPVGTTGQSATLSHAQHLEFIQFVLDCTKGRINVIAGAGSNCTRESVDMIQAIQKIASVPVLCVTGYYNIPSQEGLIQHFQTLSEETGAKIVLYNVPGRTNSYLQPQTVISLANDKNIIGLKQAVNFKPDGEHREDTLRILEATKGLDFALLSGEDDAFADILEMGGTGLITATGNIPEASVLFLEMVEAFKKGNRELCRALQIQVLDYVKLIFARKNPMPLGTFFNSPLYQPMSSVIDSEGGQAVVEQIMQIIEKKANSLKKYHS